MADPTYNNVQKMVSKYCVGAAFKTLFTPRETAAKKWFVANIGEN